MRLTRRALNHILMVTTSSAVSQQYQRGTPAFRGNTNAENLKELLRKATRKELSK